MVIRGVAALTLGLFTACGWTLPDPTIESITPNQIVQGDAPPITAAVEAVFPHSVDYGARSVELDPALILRIGTAPVEDARLNANGTITGTAPFGLPAGTYDVILELSDGRTGALPGAFVVSAGVFPEGYIIDPVGDQVAGQPFPITVRALGPNASAFNGAVQFTASPGAITPALSGPFTNGVRTEEVTLDTVSLSMVITVRDAAGHTASSNTFVVTP